MSSSLLLLVTVFAVTFVAELPDKSLFASLVLGTRYRAAHVWLGVAAAFAVHVALSVGAGGLLTLAPEPVIDFVSAGLFLGGAIWMLRSAKEDENEPGPDAARMGAPPPSFGRVFATSFTVVFIGEWGDVTQITTANFVARYHDPLIIGVAALAALWTVSARRVRRRQAAGPRPDALGSPGRRGRAHRPGHLQPGQGHRKPGLSRARR